MKTCSLRRTRRRLEICISGVISFHALAVATPPPRDLCISDDDDISEDSRHHKEDEDDLTVLAENDKTRAAHLTRK